MRHLLFIALTFATITGMSSGQSPLPITYYSETFDNMGTGTNLPSNWRIVRSSANYRDVPSWNSTYSTTVDYVVNSYPIVPQTNKTFNCFDNRSSLTTDRALGFRQATGTYSQCVMAWFVNNTGVPLVAMRVAYKLEKYYKDTNPAGTNVKLFFTYNPDAQFSESLINPDPATYWVGAGSGYTSIPDGNNSNPAGKVYPLLEVFQQATITNLSVPPNGNLYFALCFSVGDPSGNSSADHSQIWALDDFMIDELVPIELVSFNALFKNGNVRLTWKTATESNNYGFEIERSSDRENWQVVGFVEGAGTVNTPRTYVFVDQENLVGLDVVYYRLRQVDRDGYFDYSPIVSVSLSQDAFLAMRCFPNPFNPMTTISFTLPVPETITLVIFDASGKEVARLLDHAPLGEGRHSMVFDATGLSSGVFFAHLLSLSNGTSQRLILAR
ncbi:MAG: hypothetical protein QHI48_02585 [Bacteroidota bacterium]|nr:hypothetical protein [Bacteroidota bacterium]